MKKYIIFAFLLVFFNLSNVHAENIIQLDNYDTSTSANFYNCVSAKNCNNAVGANSLMASNSQIWQSKSKINLVANSYGGALSFYSKEAFIKDNYYSVSVVIGNGSNTNFTTVTTSENYAVGTGNSVNNAFSNVIMTVNRSANNGYAVYKMLGSENKNIGSAMGLTKNSLLCYTFKAPANGNTVVLTFTTTSTITHYLMFYGYKVTSHGAKAPSTTDIKNALNSSFNNINSNIDKVNANVNSVNSNIDKLKEQENANHTEAEKTRKGILSKVGDIVKGITNLPGLIWNSIKGGFDAITGAITNMVNSIKGFFDNLIGKITSDEVDDSKSNSFFDSFNNTDHGGISGVITSPLKAINKINVACTSISFNIFDHNIELPCGDTLFWNKTEVSTFKNVWNILLGGPIIYLLMLKLFHTIQGLKNPDDSKIEVVKL